MSWVEPTQKADTLRHRLAAWLLTLPGPFAALSRDLAARDARQLFDPSSSQAQFEDALRECGYIIRSDKPSCFMISFDADG